MNVLAATKPGARRAVARLDTPPGRRQKGAAALGLLAALGLGCQQREAPEVTLARVTAESRLAQIENLERLIAEAETREIVTTDQIAIGVSEDLVRDLLQASPPPDTVVANRIRVRFESAQTFFRGGQAQLLFRARASSTDLVDAGATVELGGGLDEFTFEDGRLLSRVKLKHFSIIESSLGELGESVLDGLVRGNLEVIQNAIPRIEIPVRLEQSIRIGGLTEGAVVARGGVLLLGMSVSRVIPVNQRLWVLVRATAGPWRADSKTVAK